MIQSVRSWAGFVCLWLLRDTAVNIDNRARKLHVGASSISWLLVYPSPLRSIYVKSKLNLSLVRSNSRAIQARGWSSEGPLEFFAHVYRDLFVLVLHPNNNILLASRQVDDNKCLFF